MSRHADDLAQPFRGRALPTSALLVVAALSATAAADEADVFNFRTSLRVLHDDNFFRASRSRDARSETTVTETAGIDFDKRISLQRFAGQINWVNVQHARNKQLDAGSLHYDVRWLWAVGSKLQGDVSAGRSEIQNSFADIVTGDRRRNLRSVESQRASLNYLVNPSWQILSNVFRQTVSNEQDLPEESDFEATGAGIGLRYQPASGSSISFLSRRTDGHYTRAALVLPGLRQFSQRGQEIAFTWVPTGKSAFSGRLERIERQHEDFPSRNFSGLAGQLTYLYQYSGKTALTVSYLRNLSPFQPTFFANYAYYAGEEFALGAQWAATGKLAVAARVGYLQRHYRGGTSPARDDDTLRLTLDATYQAARWLDIKAGIVAERRASSVRSLDYDDRQIFLMAIARF